MSQDEFTKLFKYMQEMRLEMNDRFEVQDKKIDNLTGAVAVLAAQIREYHQEMIFLTHKVERLERWIHEIAKQTGMKLSEA